jgi:hypothetical protein
VGGHLTDLKDRIDCQERNKQDLKTIYRKIASYNVL